MKKTLPKPPKRTKDESKKQDEPLMGFDEFVRRIVRVKPHELKPKRA